MKSIKNPALVVYSNIFGCEDEQEHLTRYYRYGAHHAEYEDEGPLIQINKIWEILRYNHVIKNTDSLIGGC